MSTNALAAAFCIAGGVAVAVQAAMNGALGRRVGVLETAFLAGVVTMLVLGAILVATRGGWGGLGRLGSAPLWMWLGGATGAIALSAISYAPAKIGIFATLALFLGGQLLTALVIDAFGLLETERTPVSMTRILGLLFVAVGAALVLRR